MPILDWLNKDKAVTTAQQVPYRLLQPVAELSVGDADSGNMLIQGDNLEALKSLLPLYAGKVKCIYIDPPYNTRSVFKYYRAITSGKMSVFDPKRTLKFLHCPKYPNQRISYEQGYIL